MQNTIYESSYVITFKSRKKPGYIIFTNHSQPGMVGTFGLGDTKFIGEASKFKNKSKAYEVANMCKDFYKDVKILEVQAKFITKEI